MQGCNINGWLYWVSVCFGKLLSLLSYHHQLLRHKYKTLDLQLVRFTPLTMPPFINQYPHRYHPFGRPLAPFYVAKRHPCLPSLYTIFPTNPDLTAAKCPEPLMYKPCAMTAMDYFATLQKPNTPFPKNDGEVGHKPRKSHKGYVLADVLEWPMEVYKRFR